MNRKDMLTLIAVLYFFIGIGLITEFFLIEPVNFSELASIGSDNPEEEFFIIGYMTPSDIQLTERIAFTEEVYTFVLEKDGETVLVVSPDKGDGGSLVKGRFISLDPELGVPDFIYATNIRGAMGIEQIGISREGLIVLLLYVAFTLPAFIYEMKKQKD